MSKLIAHAQGDNNQQVQRLGNSQVYADVADWNRRIRTVLHDDGQFYIEFQNIKTGRTLKEYYGNIHELDGIQEYIPNEVVIEEKEETFQ